MKKITRLKKVLSDPAAHLENARSHSATARFFEPLSDSDVGKLSQLWQNGALTAHINATFGDATSGASSAANTIFKKLPASELTDLKSEYSSCGPCHYP